MSTEQTPVVEDVTTGNTSQVDTTTVTPVTIKMPDIQTASVSGLVNQAPKVVAQPKVEVAQTKKVGITFEQKIEDLKKTGSVHMQSLITELEIYIFKMAPGKPIDNTDGAHMQYVLWRTIKKITNTTPHKKFKTL
jgi:hypothetical protein